MLFVRVRASLGEAAVSHGRGRGYRVRAGKTISGREWRWSGGEGLAGIVPSMGQATEGHI